MPKLLIQSNFSNSNLAFIIVNLENLEDFENSSRVDCGANEPEFESPNMVLRKYFIFKFQ